MRPTYDSPSGSTQIYRLYDAHGRLLYVGIASSAHHRLMQHVYKHWWPDVARKEFDWRQTRVAARAEETRAVQEERPIYNATGRPEHTQDELEYMHQRAVAAIDRARKPAPGIREKRRRDKAALLARAYLLDASTAEAISPVESRACPNCQSTDWVLWHEQPAVVFTDDGRRVEADRVSCHSCGLRHVVVLKAPPAGTTQPQA